MSLITTTNFNSDLKLIVNKWFGLYKTHPELFSRFMTIEKSTDAYDVDAVYTGMGALRRLDEGSSIENDSARQEYTPRYLHLGYALGFIITKNAMRDGKAMLQAEKFSGMLKRAALETKEIVGHSVINNAFTSGVTMDGGDGVILASASHPTRNGNVSNIITATDISEAALESMRANIRKAVDNRGLKINLFPTKLVVHTDQEADAYRILNSTKRVATMDNDANFLKDSGLPGLELIVSPYLTDTDQFTMITDCPDGLKMKIRQAEELDNDNLFDTKNAAFSLDMRLVAGWSDFKGAYFSAGV